MPFQSEKQRGYLLAHPEITDKKGRSVGRKWAKKYGGKVSKIRASDVGAIALDASEKALKPRNQELIRRTRNRTRKVQGKVKKMQAPTSSDPSFNHAAAQRAFDLVMKMDDETAEMFTHIVVADYFEETIEKNLGTLQRHLNETLVGQLQDLKKAHLRLVSKGYDREKAVAYAQAITLIEKQLWGPFSKAKRQQTPQEMGYHWKESDFNRDPGSGQFRAKISHNQTTKLKNKTFRELTGVDTPDTGGGRALSYEDKVRFQDEYRQLSGFLQTVRESTGGKGNQEVMLHYRDRNGNAFSQVHTGTRPPVDDLADPNFRLMGVEAKPTTLTAGGAAFGLATALGGGMNPEQVRSINAIEGGGGTQFTNKWLESGDAKGSNAKLYGRLAASGEFLQATGMGPKSQMAGKFATIVGSAGPQAEMVLGPTARKTAYRYRGTEKIPEKPMMRAYAQGIEQGKIYGGEEQERPGIQPREARRQPKPGVQPGLRQMVADREQAAGRAPTWNEREIGRRRVVEHLWNKRPQKSLYELHLAAGNTPPSEGVIINADGQVVTQAVGYGDDHYLPFNLKNLKGLKGGEYIRSRSVGGLTSEDIYTGLISGARQVTVVSRSGTYTMTFEPDFRGGRRHSDKARRMTRRYEQLLDAVQSQQVDRTDIDPDMRAAIEREVKDEMSGPGWTRRDQMDAIQERVDEFKANPYITEDDEKRAEVIINSRAAGASEHERNAIRATVMDDLLEQKETKFRLNSAGYKGALDALQEQFPYYISKPRWTPPKDTEKKIDPEKDLGYVEPGRNRPTAAAAGLFGAKNKGKFAGQGGKFSASEADYQGAHAVAGGRLEPTKTGEPKDVHDARRKAIAESRIDDQWVEAAQELQKHAKLELKAENQAEPEIAAALGMTAEELRDPKNRKKFVDWAEKYTSLTGFKTDIMPVKRKWEAVLGHRERKPYDKATLTTIYPKYPPIFEEPEYQLGAKPDAVRKERERIDLKTKASVISGDIPLSGLTDDEYESEWRALKKMHDNLSADPTPLNREELEKIGVDLQSPGLTGKLRSDVKAVEQRMEQVQRARALSHGLDDETRKAVVSNKGKTVTTNETPDSKTQALPQENVERQIAWGNRVVSELESMTNQMTTKLGEKGLSDSHREAILRALNKMPSQQELDQAKNVVGLWESHLDELRTTEEFNTFNDTMEDDLKALGQADGILRTERANVEVLLNPPKKQ